MCVYIIGTMLSSGNSADQGILHGNNIVGYGQDGNVYVPGNLELNLSHLHELILCKLSWRKCDS